MRVVVTGSRDFPDDGTVEAVLWGLTCEDMGWNEWGLKQGVTIIEGACPYGGADEYARRFAREHGAIWETFPPDQNVSWAFHKRNRAMVDTCGKGDLVVAFVNKPLAESKGTYSTVSYARKMGVKTIVVEVIK